MTPYRLPLPPPRPIRPTPRRFRTAWLAGWQSLLFGLTAYSTVATWVVHAALFAMLLRFETPSGEPCLCAHSPWQALEWFSVLRAVTTPW